VRERTGVVGHVRGFPPSLQDGFLYRDVGPMAEAMGWVASPFQGRRGGCGSSVSPGGLSRFAPMGEVKAGVEV